MKQISIETHRANQVKKFDYSNKFSMLQSVSINPTELCNRTCSFCPRSNKKVYPNRNLHISEDTVIKLCNDLTEINFNNRIGFVGFGEPLLHKNIFNCLRIVRDIIPDIKWLDVNTNGDNLTKEVIEELYEAGCTHLAISMYDEDSTLHFEELKGSIPISIIYRHHYNSDNNYNLNIVNRTEMLENKNISYNDKPCYIPFYKAVIDWNGDVMLCDNDWGRNNIFGNIHNETFKNIWFGEKFNNIKRRLSNSRKECHPCKNCSVNGIMRGSESVEIFKKYF